MQKVPGVDTVRVSLNEGVTILELKAGNAVTLASLRAIIKNNGFVSKDATILARGASPSAKVFEVSGTGERLVVTKPPVAATGDQWRMTAAAP